MARQHSLSVILITQDEADRVRPCLESVNGWADEIVVVDSGSRDDTVAICREYTPRIHITDDWPGDGIQKQRALEMATGEWVLRIDADERVSPELRAEIDAVLARDEVEETAFRIPWSTFFFGEYLTRGEAGVAHFNLFRRQGARYEPAVVHARLLPAPGPTGRLSGRLYHDAHRDYRHLLSKLGDYACQWADERAERGETGSLARAFVSGAWRFVKVYVIKRGFLDAGRGLLMAAVYSQYAFNKHAALWAGGRTELNPESLDGGSARGDHRT